MLSICNYLSQDIESLAEPIVTISTQFLLSYSLDTSFKKSDICKIAECLLLKPC